MSTIAVLRRPISSTPLTLPTSFEPWVMSKKTVWVQVRSGAAAATGEVARAKVTARPESRVLTKAAARMACGCVCVYGMVEDRKKEGARGLGTRPVRVRGRGVLASGAHAFQHFPRMSEGLVPIEQLLIDRLYHLGPSP